MNRKYQSHFLLERICRDGGVLLVQWNYGFLGKNPQFQAVLGFIL